MNVYLAGKVDKRFGAWRDAVLSHRGLWCLEWDPDARDHDGSVSHYMGLPDRHFAWWEERQNAVLGRHTYVGPYRQECNNALKHKGIFHGSETLGQHGIVDEPDLRDRIVLRCRRAIRVSDLVFAYINSPDAYGTVAEIGYAIALGKFVSVLVHPSTPFAGDDFWFLEELATHVSTWPGRWKCQPFNEAEAVESALKDAFIARAAWEPRVPQQDTDLNALRGQEAAESFLNIAQWTSDPRVRTEAQRMVRILTASGRRTR